MASVCRAGRRGERGGGGGGGKQELSISAPAVTLAALKTSHIS